MVVGYDGDKSESDGTVRAGRIRSSKTKTLVRRSERSKKLKSTRKSKSKAEAKVAKEKTKPHPSEPTKTGTKMNTHDDLCSTERQALSQVLLSKASPRGRVFNVASIPTTVNIKFGRLSS